jgi:hypothetical protein
MNSILFQHQFEAKILAGTKTQTIRPPRKDGRPRAKRGEIASLRVWSGLPYRSKQREFARATILDVGECTITKDWPAIHGYLVDADPFAIADGFDNYKHLLHWFSENHDLPFAGVLICWQLTP